jgi:hypothetical protein
LQLNILKLWNRSISDNLIRVPVEEKGKKKYNEKMIIELKNGECKLVPLVY